MPIRLFEAEKGVGMTESEAKRFLLECKSNLLLGTIDAAGNPNVHPVWYNFDSRRLKLYIFTGRSTKKARNISKKREVYFDIDDDKWPYKGVRGKGHAKVVAGKKKAPAIMQKILLRYIKRNHPWTSLYLDSVRKGRMVVIEITPAFFTTSDYGKLPPHVLRTDLRQK